MEEQQNIPQEQKPKKKRAYVSNEQALLNYETIFTNIENQPVIKAQMAEYDYTDEKIAEGKDLYLAARQAYNANRREDAESQESRKIFDALAEEFSSTYAKHRKDTKVWYRRESRIIKQLGVFGSMPYAFAKRIEEARTFYRTLTENPDLLEPLAKFKINAETIAATKALILQAEQARADYLREKGESQDATKTKDAAFRAIEIWISDFFSIARIALEDNIQLLETLTKTVK